MELETEPLPRGEQLQCGVVKKGNKKKKKRRESESVTQFVSGNHLEARRRYFFNVPKQLQAASLTGRYAVEGGTGFDMSSGLKHCLTEFFLLFLVDKLLSSRKSDCWPSRHSPTNRQAGGQAGERRRRRSLNQAQRTA